MLADGGTSLGTVENSYFNREFDHFCSHQHTPSDGVSAGPGMAQGADGIYFAWPAFAEYATKGSLVGSGKHRLRPEPACSVTRKTLTTDLPAQGVVTLTQPGGRVALACSTFSTPSPVKRGEGIEIIEDILPLLRHPCRAAPAVEYADSPRVARAAGRRNIVHGRRLRQSCDTMVPRLECHQMVALDY